jgi:very-short-patch-repair endonuclease
MPRIAPRLTGFARDLRNGATKPERTIWRLIRHHRPRFTRQHVVGCYIVDLACREAKLAVELDGSQHLGAADDDAARTAFLKSLGWRVIRFWNSDVTDNPEGVAAAILHEADERLGNSPP